jgi:hypothetical protein
MNCKGIRERMPDVAAGFGEPTVDEDKHLESCGACAEELKAMRATMAVLDEWQAPEPSQYFDVRLQARLREEMAKPQAGWLQWFRRPVLAAALTVLLGIGVGLYFTRGGGIINLGQEHGQEATITEPPALGTAESDLQTLENNHDLYADFDLLDDMELQQDVVANP